MDLANCPEDQWTKHCTDNLVRCVAMGAESGRAEWSQLRANLPPTRHPRINDADFTGRDLMEFDLSRCKFAETKFVEANLSNASFWQSIMRTCDFTGANVAGTVFGKADPVSSIFRDVYATDQTDFAVMKGCLPDHIDLHLKERAEAAWRRDEFARDGSRGWIHKTLVALVDYGDSVARLVTAAGIIIVLFAVMFWFWDQPNTTVAEAVVYSAQYFVALSDPYESNLALSALGTVESYLGLVFLAILVSAVARHLMVER